MVVCQYFLRGQCKFGSSCRNEHPSPNSGTNRWPMRTPNPTSGQGIPSSLFSIESMTKDFTPQIEKPLWPMSSYGPAKYEPILVSNLDESPEELRVRAMTAIKSGSISDYLTYESEKILAADQVYSNARVQMDAAYNQAVANSTISGMASTLAPANNKPGSAFGGGTNASATGAWGSTPSFGGQTSSFGSQLTTFGGQPSTFGGQPSAFGGQQTAFGNQPSAFSGQSTAFGSQPSAFGQTLSTSTPPFGKPSFGTPSLGQSAFGTTTGFGQSSPSAFGQPQSTSNPPSNQPSGGFGGSGFGTSSGSGGFAALASTQPSGFGSTPKFGQSAFGVASAAPVAPATTSAFGAPSTSATTIAFGVPSANATTTAFGAPSTNATPPAFGSPAQGTTSSAFTPSPFSAFGAGQAQGQFGGTSATTTSAFGTSPNQAPASAFPSQTQGATPFASSQPQQASTSAFSPPTTQPTSAFGAFAQSGSEFGNAQPKSAFGTPAFASEAQAAPLIRGGTAFDVYDRLLPPDEEYIKMIPPEAMRAFEANEFKFGSIPEWIPPKKVR